MAENPVETLKTLIVDDEPLAVERMQVICAKIPAIQVVGTASDGAQALRLVEALKPDLILLDMTMPEVDGISVAKSLAKQTERPAVVFVTAHDNYAVEAFDLDAVDYVLKPVKPERLERAVSRAAGRRGEGSRSESAWLDELWIPHRSELIRIATSEVDRIDAERDYVRLHVGSDDAARTYLLLQTIAGLEKRLDPAKFISIGPPSFAKIA